MRELKYLAPFFTLPLVAVTTACKHKRKRERLDRRITYTFIYTYTLIIRPVLPEKKMKKERGQRPKKEARSSGETARQEEKEKEKLKKKTDERKLLLSFLLLPLSFSLIAILRPFYSGEAGPSAGILISYRRASGAPKMILHLSRKRLARLACEMSVHIYTSVARAHSHSLFESSKGLGGREGRRERFRE